MEEILREGSVSVSAALVRIGSQTYSLPNITSVRVKHADRGMPRFWGGMFGLAALLTLPQGHYVTAASFFAIAVALFAYVGDSKLFIATAGGERSALVSTAQQCGRVCQAIERAMTESATRR